MTVKRAWLAVGIAVLVSQAGHLLAYQLRFGAAAQAIQSSGAHVYFPGLVRASLGAAAALVLAGVFVVGLARLLSGRAIRPDSAPPFLRLCAAMFTIQLACFAGQEVVEALFVGAPAASVADLLLWGTLGQLPAAVMAAAGLRWLMARFETAVTEIRVALASIPIQPFLPGVEIPVWAHTDRAWFLRSAAGASLAKRGPPSCVRQLELN
ncbi:MAG TPA: hypothetical protein VFH00_06800 [Candidatus Nitrosotalea sp.]|nr:hypothetical protein [Candidatus Nitrosotalea sp.]